MTFRTASDFRRAFAAFACALALVLGLTAMAGTADATPKNGVLKGNPTNKVLASEFLLLLKAENENGLKRFLDKDFILQRTTEYLNKKEYLANPSIVDEYKVRGIVATRKSTNVRIIRFEAETTQLINGEPVAGGWLPRLSTFVKDRKSGAWKLVAHANFAAPAPTL